MNGPELLASHAGVLRTRVGACWPGTRAVFRGHDLHKDLRDTDWLELYLFGITGRRFTPQQVRLLHGIWVITSYPDPRLWNNRVAALAGSSRSSPVLGLTAALAISEANIYGGLPGVRAIDFYLRAGELLDAGMSVREIVERELAEHQFIFGFGRPINSCDERLPWLAGVAREQGLDQGKHFLLALEVEKILLDMGKANLRMNYAGMTSALGADLGLSPREFHIFRVPMFLAGMPPCWEEAAEKNPKGRYSRRDAATSPTKAWLNAPWPIKSA